jgi:hypothetical protein
VKHLARSIPNQVLAFMKSYFPKVPVEVVAGGVAANCTDEQYAELLEQMPSSSSKKTSVISECAAQTPLETLSRKGLCTFLLTWLLF